MAGYFSVIVALHLLAALVVITPSADASTLKCFHTVESCDKETCPEKEASNSETVDNCLLRSVAYEMGLKEFRDELDAEFNKSLNESVAAGTLTADDADVRVYQYYDLRKTSFDSIKDADDSDATHAHCSKLVVTQSVNLPSGTTLVRTAVVKGCSLGKVQCKDWTLSSDDKNVTIKTDICSHNGDDVNEGGKIVANKVLFLASIVLMGITGFLPAPDPN